MTDGVGGLWLMGEIQRAVAKEYNWPDGRAEEHALAKIDPSILLLFGHTRATIFLTASPNS
ncbi:MAG TPA: hypothetical protein VN901_22610 [Candidatus Acidoferrales bacterium]|nr:hypothetical protein [Candidatus Acidoferrales bacterium]